jgi:hypothetical protein
MRPRSVLVSGLALLAIATIYGCGPQQPPPQQAGPYGNNPPPGYGPGYTPGAPQPGYGPGPQGNVQTYAPTAPPPSPMSPTCQQDGACGPARCNLQYGKCSFPCGSNNDCMPGAQCLGAGTPVAACTPMLFPGMAPPR